MGGKINKYRLSEIKNMEIGLPVSPLNILDMKEKVQYYPLKKKI